MKFKKIILSSAMIFSFIAITPLASFASTNSISTMDMVGNTINGEEIVSVYEEDGELLFVTKAKASDMGYGKCPKSSDVVTKTVSRSELKRWKNEGYAKSIFNRIFNKMLFSKYSNIVTSIEEHFYDIKGDCEYILSNTSKSKIDVVVTYNCKQKIQAGNWYHVWRIAKVRLR